MDTQKKMLVDSFTTKIIVALSILGVIMTLYAFSSTKADNTSKSHLIAENIELILNEKSAGEIRVISLSIIEGAELKTINNVSVILKDADGQFICDFKLSPSVINKEGGLQYQFYLSKKYAMNAQLVVSTINATKKWDEINIKLVKYLKANGVKAKGVKGEGVKAKGVRCGVKVK